MLRFQQITTISPHFGRSDIIVSRQKRNTANTIKSFNEVVKLQTIQRVIQLHGAGNKRFLNNLLSTDWRKRGITGIIILFLTTFSSFGQQITQYSFSASSGTYTSINGGGTVAGLNNTDEGQINSVPIGFTFNFCGTNYTTLSASTNGWLVLGSTITNDLPTNSLSGTASPIIAPLWDDLSISRRGNNNNNTSANIYYQTTGTAPNRIFTIEWYEMRWDHNAGNQWARVISFQVKLYETSNNIDFVYLRQNNNVNNGSGGASIGIADGTTGSGHFLSLNGTGTAPTASSTTETSNLNARPATGQTYTFSPPVITTYYSQGSGDPNTLSNWNTNAGGGGTAPSDFISDNQAFIIQNGNNMTTTAAGWSVSGINTSVEIQNGGTLTADYPVTVSSTTTFQVDNGGTYIHNNTSSGIWAGTTSLGSSSTVIYQYSGAQDVDSLNYGNLTIAGGSTKTMLGNVTVQDTLALSNGNLSLGGNNYNLTLADGAIISGSFDSTHMIVCDGTGSLIKQSNTAAGFVMTYPVGTDTNYTPMQISSLTATVSGTADIDVRADTGTALGPPALNSTDLQKYWVVSANSLSAISADVNFTYINPGEVGTGGNQSKYIPYLYSGGSWQNPTGASAEGVDPLSSTGTSILTGTWSAHEAPNIYYSYQSGSWNSPSTWTSDPGGTTQIGSTIPGSGDEVIILPSRTVTLPSDISTTNLNVTIDAGGFLDLSTYTFTSGLSILSGQGTLKLASVNFPSVASNSFVNSGGGTTEYYNASNFTLPASQSTYNNLTINANTVTATQLSDITLNGNLYVEKGTYRINDNTSTTKLNLTIDGNVTVDNGASITVGEGPTNTTTNPVGITGGTAPYLDYYEQFHRVVIKGDFTNNGTVRFTNLNYPVFNAFPPTTAGATSGAASVYFSGATDNTLTCNSTTDFYNLIVDKGVDQTFKLTIYSSAYPNFRLFGANISAGDTPGNNPNLKKALWIRTGTLVLKGLTIIPSLTEGTDNTTSPNSDFYIPANAALILDGPDVAVFGTADDYSEVNAAYGVSGGSGLVNGVGVGGYSAISILGKLQINDGYLSTKESSGFITQDWASGQFVINGGTVDAKQIRAAGGSSGLASYDQTGGTVILRGRFQRTPSSYSSVSDLVNAPINTVRADTSSLDGTVGTMDINNANNVFTMSGGTIKIYDASGVGGRIFDIFSSTSNINVTGGTVEVIPTTGTGAPDAPSFYISSNAEIGNLLIDRVSSSTEVKLSTYDLTVLKDLTLQSGVFNANNLNISIGGDFTIANGTTYTTGTNWTTFDGSGTQTMTVNLAGALSLDKFKIDKLASENMVFAGSQKTINVSDSLILSNCNLDDNGDTINAAGSYLYNSGKQYGGGKTVMNSTVAQTIDGDGTGIFENLELNNTNSATAPISLAANLTISGALTFSQDKLFDIGTYNLSLDSTASIVNAGTTRFIQTSGNAGDGGLTIAYPSGSAITFPIGAPSTSHSSADYTPATIGFSATPSVLGSITVIPVGYEHPNTINKGRSLTYFWKVRSSGFTLGSATVTQQYTYSQNDVVTGTNVSEGGYVGAYYNSSTHSWTKGTTSDVDTTNNIIGGPGTFIANVSFIDGEYTAGDDNPTDPFGAPTIYYSRQSGLWSNVNSWSLTSHTVTNPPATPPGASDVVIIGNYDSIYLATNNYTPNTGVQNCASLQIEKGSALDIGYNPGCNFGIVRSSTSGNGNFRLTTSYTSGSTFAFPSGDFSDYNINLGTTELYSTNPTAGTTYWLPNGVTSYGNLIISPLGGSNIIFPNNDLLIYGNLITRGQNSLSWFCPTWNTNYPTAPATRVAKTITIDGDLEIQGGALVWYGNGSLAQNFVVDGDVIVSQAAGIQEYAAATNQKIDIGGSLINNAGAPAGGTNSYRGCDFTNIPLTFFGDSSSSITNTSGTPYTVLDDVTVDKGNSQSTTLTCNIGGTLQFNSSDNWLTLTNGTFKYLCNVNLPISTVSSFTISETAGLYIDMTSNVYIGNSNSNTNDLFLEGKLTLINGNVYVGPTSAGAYNNDIEYAGSGASEIDVRGGNLVVNGQIRRNPATTNGILSYNQSGGAVIVNGNNANSTNAKFEVLNSGSTFDMSAGTLTIVRGGGTSSYGDLYLRPGSSSVTGGDIIFTQSPSIGPVVDQVQNYWLEANIPLNNLTITGKTAATARNAKVTLFVSPLKLNGNLTLSNANSIFDVNSSFNDSVTIKGNFDNNGTYNHYNNTTIFDAGSSNNGGAQSITGTSATDFYNLEVDPVTSLTINDDITVNNNLTLSSGQLICGNYKVNAKGDVTNNATYTDTQYGIILNGSSLQHLSGTGTYDRLELNNNSGAKLDNEITLQKDLVLTSGIFDINQYLLTLGQNSNITGAPFSKTKMITSDGVISNVGIRKYFSTPLSTTFTYPLGSGGKYTPAVLTVNANGNVGYVQINNINSKHPTALSPYRVLNYYWEVESSGISGFDGNLVFTYSPGDVLQVPSDASSYVAARLITPGTSWSKAAPGSGTDNVDETAHTISFTFPSGTNNLSGDYTAGNDSDLPADIPEFTSIADGDWSNCANWTQTGGTPISCPAGGPNGFIVIINNNITTGTDNSLFAYKTTINDTLTVAAGTYGHNFGIVYGSGTLHLENGVLPAGDFTNFLDCSSNGTLEYGGTGSYTLIADRLDNIPNLYFTGTGTRILPNKDLTICNRLKIDGPTLDNSVNNRKLTIEGTMERYNTGAFVSGTGSNATVSFAGFSAQTIGGALGDFTGSNAFNNLEINNGSGLSVNSGGSVEVTGDLLLTNGIITTTSSNKLTLTNTTINCVIPYGGSSSSYVSGPLGKDINQGDNFQFPVGQGSYPGNRITLSSVKTGTQLWTVQYHRPNTTYSSLNSPLTAVDAYDYWDVSAPAGNLAIINLDWDATSDITPLMTQNGVSDMRVSEFDGSNWNELSSTATGNNYSGTVSTTSRITIGASGINYYAIGCINTIKPKARLASSGGVCGNIGIPLTFSSSFPISLNYTIDYTINGASQTPHVVSSLPDTLPTPVAGTYQLTGFTYNGGSGVGVVDANTVNAYAIPTTANAGSDQTGLATCGATSTALAGNTPTIGTGLWSVVSGTGGTVVTPTSPTSNFNGTNGSTYVLQWTISNGSCTSSDNMTVTFNISPSQPSSFTTSATPVCQGDTAIYAVPNDPTVSYTWNYNGADATIIGSTHTVSLAFGPNSTSGDISVTATNGCGTSSPQTLSVTVNNMPTITLGSSPNVCSGITSADLPYSATTNSPDQYSINFDTTAQGQGFTNVAYTSLPLSPVPVTIPATATSGTYNADFTAKNSSNGCASGVYPITVTINPLPIPGLTSSAASNTICAGDTITFTGLGGTNYNFKLNGASVQNSATSTYTTNALSNNDSMKVVVTNSGGCTDTSTAIITTVNALPTPSITGDTSTCEGNISTYTTANTGDSFSWNVSGGTITSGSSTNSITVQWNTLTPLGTLSGPGSVSVTETTPQSCPSTTPGYNVIIHRVPKTGPQYHTNNKFSN